MSYWRVHGRSVSKAATSPEKNQDRWSKRLVSKTGEGVRLRVAVADGATQSYRPAAWADGLIAGAMNGTLRATRWSSSLARESRDIAAAWQATGEPLENLPWHQQARALRGGAAAFVGVEIWRRHNRWLWRALAIGDSNLFHFNARGELLRSFPLAVSSFSYRPTLLTTKVDPARSPTSMWSRARGELSSGDVLVLASDAVAWWLLGESAGGSVDLEAMWGSVAAGHRFELLVAELRAAEAVPDDDMTMVMVERR